MSVRPLIVVLLSATACSVNVNFGEGPFLCMSEPRQCSDGFVCDEGVCVPLGGTDGGAVDSASADGALVAPVVPGFGPPTPIEELSEPTSRSDDASYSSDRLYVLFNSDRGGVSELYSSSRPSVDSLWRAPFADTPLNSPSNESTVAVSADGLRAMFGSDRPGGVGGLDVYLATRAVVTDAWSAPVLAAGLNSVADDAASWISDDGLSVIVHSQRDGDYDLFVASRSSTQDPFADIEPITEVNSDVPELSARFARGGLVITFHSNRAGGAGSFDLYAATRVSIDQPFGPAVAIEGVNTENLDEDAWLSDDLCYIAYATTVAGATENQLVEATCLP